MSRNGSRSIKSNWLKRKKEKLFVTKKKIILAKENAEYVSGIAPDNG